MTQISSFLLDAYLFQYTPTLLFEIRIEQH